MAFTSYTYQVFLSFRGEDTRKNFTDHLYSALSKAGIVTFRDDNSIQRGENIELEIEKAIQESQMSVVVLSKDYASSTWCLDELVMIMDRKRTAGHIVLPVFYDVDPSQVGEQTGNYAEAFAKHQDHFQDDMERVEKWKAALKEVAYLGGMVLQDRHESQFIGDIVEEVGKRLDSTVLLAPSIAWHRYWLLVKKTMMIRLTAISKATMIEFGKEMDSTELGPSKILLWNYSAALGPRKILIWESKSCVRWVVGEDVLEASDAFQVEKWT
ncbi:disease resistance protein RUN1-like [Populus alba x Populus x berolinensis]|nr:disease resistance protein RUN1-like [Populus alba x Populus x berolinensis]